MAGWKQRKAAMFRLPATRIIIFSDPEVLPIPSLTVSPKQ